MKKYIEEWPREQHCFTKVMLPKYSDLIELGPDTPATPGLEVGGRVVSVPFIGRNTVGYSNTYPGGFAEYMLLGAATCLPVPRHLSDDEAALIEPTAVGLFQCPFTEASVLGDSCLCVPGSVPALCQDPCQDPSPCSSMRSAIRPCVPR